MTLMVESVTLGVIGGLSSSQESKGLWELYSRCQNKVSRPGIVSFQKPQVYCQEGY